MKNISRLLFIASITALLSAWAGEYIFGLTPCPLCLYQRYLFVALMLSSGLMVSKNIGDVAGRAISIVLLIGLTGLGAYQVLIEEGIIEKSTFCEKPTTSIPSTIDDLHTQLMQTPYAPCDIVQFRFLGVSMAGYSLMLSILLLLGTAMPRYIDRLFHQFVKRFIHDKA